MKLLESKIFDCMNFCLCKIQDKLDGIRQNSFILSNLDFLILFSIFVTFAVSIFAKTELIGIVSAFVPFFVVLKVLMTKGEKLELERCNFYLLIYLLICLISNFTSSMLPQSLYGFMKTLIYFAFYFAMCQFLKNNKKYIVLILLMITSFVVLESCFAVFVQHFMGLEVNSSWQDMSYVNPEDVLSRIYGTLQPYNPNLFAGYLIACFPAVLGIFALVLKKGKLKSSIISLAFVLVTILALLLSGCRGAYIALFATFIGIIIASYLIVFKDFNSEKLKFAWKSLFGLCSFCGVAFLTLNHSILNRIMSIFILRGDSSTSFRMNVYNSAVQMFQDNWACGIGVGNKVFREIYGLYMLTGFDALSCYCVFLEMAVESGIFALFAYLLFLGSLLGAGFRCFINSKDYEYKVLLFVSFIAIVSVMVHGLVDTVYFRPQIQYIFWTMVAILTVLTRKDKVTE